MFNLFSNVPLKKFIVYNSELKPYYEATVANLDDDERLKAIIAKSRLFLKIEDTYYYRTTAFN